MSGPVTISRLREIAERFDALLIDQYGVLHDGRALYPGASATLDALKAAGKRIAVLTNSGRRAAANRRRMLGLGLDDRQFDAVVSSGEAAFRAIASGGLAVSGAAMVIGKRGEDYGLDGLGLTFTESAAEAGTLMVMGTDVPDTPLAAYGTMLKEPARRGVPMICCNPDHEMMTSQGVLPAPGAIAALYAGLGGKVTFVGKPEPMVYELALAQLGQPDRRRTLCIGDSPEHDVAGGRRAGLATLLVLTGLSAGSQPMAAEAERPQPDYILPALIW